MVVEGVAGDGRVFEAGGGVSLRAKISPKNRPSIFKLRAKSGRLDRLVRSGCSSVLDRLRAAPLSAKARGAGLSVAHARLPRTPQPQRGGIAPDGRWASRRSRCRPAGALGVYEIVDGYRDAGPTGLRTTAARLVSDRWRIRAANRS